MAIEARKDFGIGLTFDDCVNIFNTDASTRDVSPVGFGHVGFGAEHASGVQNGLFKGPVLERVERIVVGKHSDGALRRQHVGGMLNREAQSATA
jgi:hypothetical protein